MKTLIKNFKITQKRISGKNSMSTSHVHEDTEIYYLLNGEATILVNQHIYHINEGDIVMLPPGTIHRTTYERNDVRERFAIMVSDDVIDDLKEDIGKELIDVAISPCVISVPEKRRDYVTGLMSKLMYEYGNHDELAQAFAKIGIQELLLFIIRCRKYEENVIKEIDVANALMQQIVTYIYENYKSRLTLDSVSKKFSISPSYLSKKFKYSTGFGFKEYITNVRIKNACEMLLNTDKSITDIAFDCGFNDSNYFGDAFKSVKGMSPNKYRKNADAM